MARVLLNQVVHTDYGQFDIVWADDIGFDGSWDRFFDGQVNGLVGAASGSGVYLNLARRSGGSRVRLTVHESEPPVLPETYEDVVEVPVQLPHDAEVRWSSWAGESSGSLGRVEGGSYRLRVSAQGRDAGREDELEEGVVDEYELELWPAEPAPDAIVRVGSQDAAYWHREVGNRR
jgi:hypothetical protein